MKDPYSVLLQKEREMQRVRTEVEALRSIAPLLAEDSPADSGDSHEDSLATRNRWPLQMK